MSFAVYKDGTKHAEFSTLEQCAAEILVKRWCIVEQFGTHYVRGIEVRKADGTALRNPAP